MRKIARRASLVAEVAELIRENLRTGQWSDHLPSEHFLCDLFQVSRTTLRKALAVLQREGLVDSSRGTRRRITSNSKHISKVVKSNVVGLLSAVPRQSLSPFMVFHLSELRRHLQDVGYELQVHAQPLVHLHNPIRELENALHRTQAACWILMLSSPQIQRWFVERKLPVIVSGSCHERIQLPSFDVHYRAVCRHAVGVFMGLGHRRVALITPKTGMAGDLASEQGFREGFEIDPHPDANPLLGHHDSTVQGIRKTIDSLLRLQKPPTGILVSSPRHVLTVFSHLLDVGMRLPQHVSLISRDYDLFFNDVIPSIAHYELDHSLYASRLARLVVQLASTGFLAPRPTRVMPRLKKGDTLGQVPGKT